jgi:hypothetical protein
MGRTAEKPKLESRQGQDIFLFYIASEPALGPTGPPVQRVSRGKRQGREPDDTSI